MPYRHSLMAVISGFDYIFLYILGYFFLNVFEYNAWKDGKIEMYYAYI